MPCVARVRDSRGLGIFAPPAATHERASRCIMRSSSSSECGFYSEKRRLASKQGVDRRNNDDLVVVRNAALEWSPEEPSHWLATKLSRLEELRL